jgi:hypothetical protein
VKGVNLMGQWYKEQAVPERQVRLQFPVMYNIQIVYKEKKC